jgi:hypothetical protein
MQVSAQRPYNIPIPDPSLLTTEAIRREMGALRDSLDARLAGMDRASTLLHDQFTKVPNEIERAVQQFERLQSERFESIRKQFEERDVRSKAAELAAQVAVGAALQAQKEAAGAQNESNSAAITKSESATVKQIDGILALLNSNGNALSDKIGVINGRLDRGEGHNTGIVGTVAMGISILAAVASVIIAIYSMSNHSSQPSPVLQSYQSPHN